MHIEESKYMLSEIYFVGIVHLQSLYISQFSLLVFFFIWMWMCLMLLFPVLWCTICKVTQERTCYHNLLILYNLKNASNQRVAGSH